MKKIVIAALAAVISVCLAACGDQAKNDGSGRVKKIPPKTQTTEAEDTTETEAPAGDGPAEESTPADESEKVITTEAPDETDLTVEKKDEPENSKAADSTADSSADAAKPAADTPFTFSADSTKWDVAEENGSATITYKSDDIQYAKGNCTIMINSRVVEDMADRMLSELADAIIDSKGLTDSVTVNDRGQSVLNGHDAYTMNCLYTIKDVKFDLDITIMAEDTRVVEVWVISYQDCTDAMSANFDEVLKTIAFA